MTRITRKGIVFIVCAAFVAFLLGLFAWATEGFTNWNGSTWFNYWGKGAPIVTTPEKQADTAYTVRSRNAGIIHDSDDASTTVNVEKCTAVGQVEAANGGISVGTFLSKRKTLRITGYSEPQSWNSQSKEYTYAGSNPFIFIPYDDITDMVGGRDKVITLTFINVGYDDYLDSEPYTLTFYFPSEGKTEITPELSGTTVRVDLPYDYEYIYGSNGSATVHNTLGIVVSGYFEGSHIGCNIACNVPVGENWSADSTGVYDYNAEDMSDSPFTLYDTDTVDYFEIDLTKLSFVDRLSSYCSIKFRTLYSYGYRTVSALCKITDFDFSITKLAAPTNITYTNGTLSWDAVENAQGYSVFYDDVVETVTEPSYSLNGTGIAEGENTIRIRALGNVGHTLAASNTGVTLSAYNASTHIVQLVTLTYNINGETATKFIPHGKEFREYLYEVEIPNKEFGGWYYDEGFSRPVVTTDTITADTVIYARLSDNPVTERQLTWWEIHKWQVLIPCFVVAGLLIIAVIAIAVKKKRGK